MYFEKFPKLDYNFNDMFGLEMKDIFRRVKFTEETEDDSGNFETYVVKDGEKPEDVANDFYGSYNYWWVVLLSNGIIDVENEWPKSNNEIQYMFSNYLHGYSYFVMESLDIKPNDIMVKRDVGGSGGMDISVYGVIDSYDKLLHKIDIKGHSDVPIDVDDEVFIWRNTGETGGENLYTLIDGFGETGCYYQTPGATACSIISGPSTSYPTCCTAGATFAKIHRRDEIKDSVSEFKYQSDVINPYALYEDEDDVVGTGDFLGFQNLCGITGCVLYNHIKSALGPNVDINTIEDEIVSTNERNRNIRLLSPSLLSAVNTEITALLKGNVPRGTTKIIE